MFLSEDLHGTGELKCGTLIFHRPSLPEFPLLKKDVKALPAEWLPGVNQEVERGSQRLG